MRFPAQRGFGLVELMIALTLGLLLGTAVLQITLASQRSQRLLDAAARLQEGGRLAAGFLIRDLRTAGYMGCPNLQRVSVNIIATDPPDDFDFTPAKVLVGHDNVAASNDYNAVAGTDFVVIQRAAPSPAQLSGNLDPNNANIQIVSNPAGLGAGDFVFLTDCVDADLFEATSVSANPSGDITIAHGSNVNDNPKLSKIYGSDAELLGFQSIAYFVRDSGRDTPGGEDINSLYIKARNLGGGTAPIARELVEGVEDMQLTYGEDTDGDNSVDVYRTAANVGDWSAVLSVRIELLMQSLEDNIVGSSGVLAQSSLTYNGSTVAQDGRLRQVFSTAVAIRNRLP